MGWIIVGVLSILIVAGIIGIALRLKTIMRNIPSSKKVAMTSKDRNKRSLLYITIGSIMVIICAILASYSTNAWGPHAVVMIAVAVILLIIAIVLFVLAYRARRK